MWAVLYRWVQDKEISHRQKQELLYLKSEKSYSNMTSFFRFVNKLAIYRLGIISLAHAAVHVTDFSVVNVHVDKLSSARILAAYIVCDIGRKCKYK